MSRWLGIDHGHKRIGVAVGDTQTLLASPVRFVAPAAAKAEIVRLAKEYGAAGVVVGWPLNIDGSEGPQGRLAREFAVELERATGLDVRLWDERLSSFAADQLLRGHFTRQKKRRRQDAIAAAAFLNDFLGADGRQTAPRASQAAPPEQGR